MIYTEMTNKAMRIAYKAHEEQKDRAGVPYVFHPYHLAEKMNSEELVCIALLHDVVEDSKITIDDLAAEGFTDAIIDAVKALTHTDDLSYDEYISRVKSNRMAKIVKLADLEHNMNLSRLNSISDKDIDRVSKYRKAKFDLLRVPVSLVEKDALVLECCEVTVPDNYRFCPMCGKKIDLDKAKKTRAKFDPAQTLGICECGHGVPFVENYCWNCGKKHR